MPQRKQEKNVKPSNTHPSSNDDGDYVFILENDAALKLLFNSCDKADTNGAKAALKQGADPKKLKSAPLQNAIMKGSQEIFDLLFPMRCHDFDYDGAFVHAAESGLSLQTLKTLFQYANPNHWDASALVGAVKFIPPIPEVVDFLLDVCDQDKARKIFVWRNDLDGLAKLESFAMVKKTKIAYAASEKKRIEAI